MGVKFLVIARINKHVFSIFVNAVLLLASVSALASGDPIFKTNKGYYCFSNHSIPYYQSIYFNDGYAIYDNYKLYPDGRIKTCKDTASEHIRNYGVNLDFWDEGWGGDNICKKSSPANNLMQLMELIKISKAPTQNGFSDVLNKMYGWTNNWVKSVKASCVSPHGPYQYGADFQNGTMTFHLNSFQGDLVSLASVFIHEARHAVKLHDGGDKCPLERSCDSDLAYKGANAYSFMWTAAYYLLQPQELGYLRSKALDHAKFVRDNNFVNRPNIIFPGEK